MNKRGQETRKHIKKCACSLFAEKGFKEVTMKDICEEMLNKYEKEMLDSQSSLSIAICEYFSIPDIANQSNTLYEQYLISANTWKKLIQYGIDRHEFHEVDISAVFHLIVFSYQGVRMYSKLMPIEKEIPSGIIKEIRNILVKSSRGTGDE